MASTPPAGGPDLLRKENTMPIFSYLAYPEKGRKKALVKALTTLEFCEVLPADNADVLLLVTDTPDEETEKELQEKFRKLESLQSLGMTFGHGDQ